MRPRPTSSQATLPLPRPGGGIAVISERESLGDGFYKLHLLRALRRAYPAEAIDWYVSEGPSPYGGIMAPIVASHLRQVVPHAGFRRPWPEAMARLRSLPPYSLVIDNRTNNAVVMATRLLLRAHLYQAPTPGYLFCSRRPGGGRPLHKLARLMKLLEAVTAAPADGAGAIDLPPAAVATAARLLPPGPRYVGLVPGASGPERCWPLERYIELAGRIAGQGAVPAFVLGPVEQKLLAPLRQAVPRALFPGCGATETLKDVELSLALGRRLAAAVSNDTGTGHLLAAAGTPLLSLFGPTDPRVWRPVGAQTAVIWARDHGGPEMARIPIGAVTAALQELMRQG
jgi:ADP-heptose:LPS heptosyltransferase